MLRLIPILAALVLLAALLGCEKSVSWKQKLTLLVETPAGTVSGSSVTEVTVTENARFWARAGNAIRYNITGEAVVVEVAPGRYLFALLRGAENWAAPLATAPTGVIDPWPWFRSIAESKDTLELTGDTVPMLVTFEDINDPKSVQLVDPDDLAASFGPSVGLTKVTLEITQEPVTEGQVEEVLKNDFFVAWANQLHAELAKGRPNENPYFKSLTARMSREEFMQGEPK